MILGSKSPRRKEILTSFGFNVKIEVADIEEVSDKIGAKNQIEDIALKKAKAISDKFNGEYIVTADTAVVIDNKILGKPENRENAKEMLRELSGKEHYVITAFALLNVEKGIEIVSSATTTVKFRNLSDETIEWYLDTNEPFDKAGSYGIQGLGNILVEKIEGDFFTVMGFPLSDFVNLLLEKKYTLKEILKF